MNAQLSPEGSGGLGRMSSGALVGWAVALITIVVGMGVAWFMLDAGQTWVVDTRHEYTQIEHTEPADAWVPLHSAARRSAIWHGAEITEEKVEPLNDKWGRMMSMREGARTRALNSNETVTLVHLGGSVTMHKWLPTGSDALAEAHHEGWTDSGETSTWATPTALPYNTTVQNRPASAYFSWSRTIGVWLAAILTLFIMSFLIGDNPFYKTAEAIVVGASAAYWMVYSFYTGIVDKLLVNLSPELVRGWTTPGLSFETTPDWIYIIPAVLSIMLIWRLSPKGGWIARWPLAFIIGATAGFRLLSHLESDFLLQIKSTITTLWAVNAEQEFVFWDSVGAVVILLSVLACLTYFFFSMEHKGIVGKTARGGIFVLMVTFGAAFGLTVMGRITLLTERFDFLFKEWLHLL